MNFALDNFQEKEIVCLSVPEGITTVEVEITLSLGIEYTEGTAVITKGEAKITQKAGTLLSQPTFAVTINKGNTITFGFNRKVTSQALLLKGELKDTVRLKVGERLYDTKLSNSYYLRSPSLFLQLSPIVFDKKEGEHNDFFVLSNTGIGGVKDIYFSVDYPKEVFLIDLKYKGKEILPIGVVPVGYANAGAPLYRVEGTFFKEKKDRIIIYEHYTVANCQANCPIKYATYWGDNTLHFYETKEEIKLLHPKEEPTIITLSDDTYTLTTTESTTTTATTVGSVFTNDRINGKPIDIQKVIFSLLPQSTPTSFVITKDGNIIVPPQTPIGRYTLNYRICDNSQTSKDKNHKPVCQTATVTIAILQSVTTPTIATSTTVTATTTPTIVTPTVITLSDDTYTVTTTASTTTTATIVGSVFTNDRLNGKPIDIQKVIFSLLPQSTSNSFVITKDGNIIIPPQTPVGRYTLNYCICDNSQTLKNKNYKPVCQTATVTIVILQSVTTPTTTTSITVTATTTPTIITLSDDTYTVTTTESATTTATTVGSVFTNDRLNGKPIDIQKVIFSLQLQSTPTSFVITKDGNIIVPGQTPIGRYTLNYRICDNSQPLKNKSQKPICETATVTIAILQSVTTLTTTSTTITTTTTPTIITLSDDTYTITTTESTTTTATTVGSVFTNDRLNGKPIDIQKVIFSLLSQSTPTSFVITKEGNIIVPPHTPIGRYILNYRICDNSQTSKDKNLKPICQTATVTIVILQSVTTPTTTTSTTVTATTTPTVVTPTVITLSDDTYTITTTVSTTTTATTVGSVLSNDRLNGKPIDIKKVIFSLLPQSTPNTFVITKEGNIIVPAHTPIGRYTLNYRICDNSQTLKNKNQKPVCQIATVTIAILQSVTTPTTTASTTVTATITPTIITLSDDTYTLTTTESITTIATTVGSVFTNDRLNGKPIDIKKVIFSLLPQSTPNTFVITKEGNIIVPAHTPIGRYTLNYRICDNSQTLKNKNQKPVCQIATVTIAILQSVTTPTTTASTTVTATITPTIITLSDDTYTLTTTHSTTTTATTVGSVFTNDRMNGKPIDIQKVIFSLLPQSTPTSFIITKDGSIIVPAQTPIGRYTLNYRICDNSQPLKDKSQKPVCQTATVTIAVLQSITTPTTTTPTTATSTTITATTTPTIVTPTVITLSNDTYTVTTTESTTTTATTVGSVFANDRLNGKPIDIQKVIFSLLPQSTPNTFIITKDGNIIIPPHTPIGRYTLNYRICDNSQLSKDKSHKPICQTATVTITILQSVTTPTTATSTIVTATTTPTIVTPTTITLSDDTYTVTTTESTTTTATTVGSVFTNDRLNGKLIDIQKVIFSLLPQSTSTSFVITKDGNIIVPAQTRIGCYTLNYHICDNSQPSKDKNHKPICQTATVTIAILQSVTTPTTTTNTTVTATTTPTVVTPTILTLSDDTYTVTTTETATTTTTTVGSVFTNDRLNGKPINIQKVIFSLLQQSTPTSFVITKDGNIIVPGQTPIGRYTLNYRICDNSQPLKNKSQKSVCQTATVTIAVLQSVTTPTTATNTTLTTTTTPTLATPTVITLSDDTYTLTTTESTTTTATTVGSVFTNDCLNGKPIDIKKVIFSLLPQSTPTSFVITKEGNIIVPPHTPIGRYTLNYRICDNYQTLKDKSLKPVCQIATVTIVVLQSVTTPTTTSSTTTTATVITPTIITLSDDTYTLTTTESVTTTATTVGSVFSNDRLNGKPIDIQKVIFSLLPQSTPNTFIITKDGNIIIPPHTPIGRYTLNYRICDNSQPSKNKNFKPICQTATVTIAVLQSVTTPTTATNTTVTATTTTATVVTPTVIALSDDTYTVTTTESTTTIATTVGSVFTNDRLNGKPIDIQKVIFSLLPQSTPISFVITKDGNIIVPAKTPIGRYTLNYRICDNSQTSKDNSLKPICQTTTVTIAILQSVTTPTTTTSTTVTATTTPTVITLSDDTYTLTTTESTTTTATTVGSVFNNDRMNGKPIDIQKVIFSLLLQSTPNTFIITKDGNIIVPVQTPIGCYTLNYRICDNSQPSKDKNHKPVCQTATVTIAVLQSVTTPTTATSTTTTATVVTPTVITLSDDTYTVTTTESTTTTATTVGSVFANDRLNGKPIDIQKVIFSLLPQSTPTSFVITKDGNIILPAQTPIGRYTLNYRICDSKNKNQKPICQTATITITILLIPVTPTVSATVETDTSSTTQSATNQPIAVSDSATTPMNTPIRIAVLDNDTPYTASPKIVVFPTNGDAFVKEDNTILYRPRVRFIGTDYFIYELCTPSSQSCTTATVTIKVTHRVVPDNAMSANGDDKNDYFHIVGIENYPDNQVTIYNRNGEKVFTISHYDNRQRAFKGIVEGEVSLSNPAYLPQDTYFYLIKYYDENRQLQRQIGWLYLKR
ncbi:T9SS type B sorting domain-containing protein [Capnocytophaga leadbetteri]